MSDELAHAHATVEEWTFEWWSAEFAGVALYRLVERAEAWYGWALWRPGEPVVHVVVDGIRRRNDPMIAKADAFWAEFTCEHAFEQWTIGNETYAVELDAPRDALTGARGTAVPIASDLEWYATSPAVAMEGGYEQRGVLLGDVETVNGVVSIPEVASRRTHRWGDRLPPAFRTAGVAHLGPNVAFAFPHDVVIDLVLDPNGWATRP
ncbi:MAG: hypothetical protein FJW18_06360 [Actinobacteria bacterium]|nr:hypothetical protein [Actinomycetota bacterium]